MTRLLLRASILVLFAFFVTLQFLLKQPPETQVVNVFGSFWDSGRAAWAGTNPYDAGPFTIQWQAGPYSVVERNLNPPSLLPFFQLLSLTDVYTAARLWLLLSAGLFVFTALHLTRSAKPYQLAWLFLLPIDTLAIGQIYMPLFALAALAWTALNSDRQVVAGIAIGLIVAAKPNFAVLPMLLFCAGHWRTTLAAGVTAAILFVQPVLIYGSNVYFEWMAAVKLDNHGAIFPADVSIIGFFKRVGIQFVGPLLAGSLLVGAALLTWRNKSDLMTTSKLALPLSLLCAPLAWTHYVIVVVPTLFDAPWSARRMAAAALLLIPASVNLAVVGTAFVVPASILYVLPIVLLAFDAFIEFGSRRSSGAELAEVPSAGNYAYSGGSGG
jgi:hypothetical protein